MSADDFAQDTSSNTGEDDDPFRRVRLEKLAALRGMGIEPYPVSFAPLFQHRTLYVGNLSGDVGAIDARSGTVLWTVPISAGVDAGSQRVHTPRRGAEASCV